MRRKYSYHWSAESLYCFQWFFFVNVAKDIEHNSINDKSFISKQIDKLCTKKATGHDGISSKLLKLAKPSITGPITSLVNTSFTTLVFPDSLKIAQIKPLHKKKSAMDKSKYRPVSILPIISKKFERAINAQIVDFFNNHFNIHDMISF